MNFKNIRTYLSKNSNNILYIFICLILFFLTFPKIEPDLVRGLDGGYIWALNYLFDNNFSDLKDLIFPIGPLGMLKLPLTNGNNLMYSLLFFTFFKFLFMFIWAKLAFIINQKKEVFISQIGVLTIICYFLDVDLVIIGNVLLFALLFLETKKLKWLIFSTIIASIGFLIKSSIGINSLSILFFTFLWIGFKDKNIKDLTIKLGFIGLTFFITGSLLLQSITNFIAFFWNTLVLSQSYSSAIGLHPTNNWWILSFFLACFFIFPLIIKTEKAKKIYVLFAFPLFGMWKHSMSREDCYHNDILLYFLILYWGIILFYVAEQQLKIIILAILSVLLYYSNMKNIYGFKPKKIEIAGVYNFEEAVWNYKEFVKKNEEISHQNLEKNKLSDTLLNLIGKETIDIYPWDLTYIPTNNLNWSKRRPLQGGSFSAWIDEKCAQHFEEENKPNFILIHLIDDFWQGKLGSIDHRYLLNDEPLVWEKMLKNYNIVYKNPEFLLLKKSIYQQTKGKQISHSSKEKWNMWINVPKTTLGILRAKFTCKPTLTHKIRDFFYKGFPTYIEYKLESGQVYKYRFIQSNAKNGLWINPLILHPETNTTEDLVTAIRFTSDDHTFFSNEISLEWENLVVEKMKKEEFDYQNGYALFNKNVSFKKNRRMIFNDSFENDSINTNNKIVHKGKKSHFIQPNNFSKSFKLQLDTVWNDSLENIEITTGIWYYSTQENEMKFVMSLENSLDDFWEGKQIYPTNEWRYLQFSKKLKKSEIGKSGNFNIYVWCTGDKTHVPIYLDDFKVYIKK